MEKEKAASHEDDSINSINEISNTENTNISAVPINDDILKKIEDLQKQFDEETTRKKESDARIEAILSILLEKFNVYIKNTLSAHQEDEIESLFNFPIKLQEDLNKLEKELQDETTKLRIVSRKLFSSYIC